MRARCLFIACLLTLAAATAPGQNVGPDPDVWNWRFVAGGSTVGPGAFAANGTFYFASEDRYLYAVDRTGTMVWRTDLGRRPAGGVVVASDGSVLVTLANGDLVALNPDGRLIWRERVSEQQTFAPVALANGLIITAGRQGLVQARTHFGRLIWSYETDETIGAAPTLAGDGNVVVPTTGGELILLTVDGRLVRKRYVGEAATVVVADGDGVLAGSAAGRIVRVDSLLEPVWRADVGAGVTGLFVGAAGDTYATGDDGSLSRVTPDGVFAWRAEPGSPVTAALAGEAVLAAVRDGRLALFARDGAARWQMPLRGRPQSIAASPYGTIVVTTESWVTYAFPIDFRPEGPWPEDRGGADRRGVVRGADSGRVDLAEFNGSVRYLALRRLLLAGGQSEQVVAMSGVAARVRDGEDLAGSHQYLLQLSEMVAGAPHFGPLTRSGPVGAPRRAREEAVWVLGEIGDLATSRFLVRLLERETDASMQASILQSMSRLGTPIDEQLAARLYQIVRSDIVDGPDDALGAGVAAFVAAIDEYRGGYLHRRIAESLLAISDASYSRGVRDYALATLRALAGGAR